MCCFFECFFFILSFSFASIFLYSFSVFLLGFSDLSFITCSTESSERSKYNQNKISSFRMNKVRNALVANRSVFSLFITEIYFRQCNELNPTLTE